MRVIVFGSTGLIGKELVKQLSTNHEVVEVSRSSTDMTADYTNQDSLVEMFEKVGSFDALINVAGRDTQFVSVDELMPSHFEYGAQRKLLGQVNLVLIGQKYINEGGVFTLSSGYLNHYPNPYSMATGPFNAFIDNFVETMSSNMKNGIRLNVVSPSPVVQELTHGHVTPEFVSKSYKESMEGNLNGHVFKAWNMEL
jgi:NAD(P)-dependent dehydrogenase (short-subunit alcohol dehydrogenase family)